MTTKCFPPKDVQNIHSLISKLMSSSNTAGFWGLLFSFLIPFVGIILFFLNNKTVSNASYYLISALAGFFLIGGGLYGCLS